MSGTRTHYRACNLCEAICGIEIRHRGSDILSIRGDPEDPFSRGHICPKAVALQDVQKDPDRLRRPLRKTASGWQEIGWREAVTEAVSRLRWIQERHGHDAVGVYLGNPTVHNLEAMLFGPAFFRQLKTRNRYSATSVDQLPHHLAAMLMFGHPLRLPVPDIDRTDFMLILGANPVVSNGSIMTAPGVRKRLLAMVRQLFVDERVCLGHLEKHVSGLRELRQAVSPWTPESVAGDTGISADEIRSLVRRFCAARRAVLYARIGVSTHPYGSLCNWLVNVFNLLGGNLDTPGGAMFTRPAVDLTGTRKVEKLKYGRWHSRVRKYPETMGELPVSTLADEILTPGEGQIRAMVVAAGNPLRSTPNNQRLESAFEALEFQLSIDFYLNETSSRAAIILPPPAPLERPHYDLVFNQLAVRDVARYSAPLFRPDRGQWSEAEIYRQLSYRMACRGFSSRARGWLKLRLLRALGPEGLLKRAIARGPRAADGLDFKAVRAASHGLDLGPLEPRLPGGIQTASGKIELAPEVFLTDLARLAADGGEQDAFVLIGRRDPRTCNSWLHNSQRMVKGKPRCVALLHPRDAERLLVREGERIEVRSRVGKIRLPARISEEIMPGVVSIPHGWGHDDPASRLRVAAAHPGVSVNRLSDEQFTDSLSGNAAFNGLSVSVSRLSPDNPREEVAE